MKYNVTPLFVAIHPEHGVIAWNESKDSVVEDLEQLSEDNFTCSDVAETIYFELDSVADMQSATYVLPCDSRFYDHLCESPLSFEESYQIVNGVVTFG